MATQSWTSAEHYESFMGRWSRLLAAAVVDSLDAPPGLRWLDVGCGTGALSQAVISGTAPLTLIGIDPSAAYVSLANSRANDGRASFLVGHADRLPLPDCSVDRVVSALVLNFVPDASSALREMRRVLVPGGIVTAYVWDYSDGMHMLRHFWDAAIAKDASCSALNESAELSLCKPGGLARAFADAGLVNIASESVEVPTVFVDFDDYWTPFLGGQGPASMYCLSLSDEARDQLKQRLAAALPTDSDGSISLVARAWLVHGTVSEADYYYAALPPKPRAMLEQVRSLVLELVPSAEEAIRYQIPTMTLDGKSLVHFAAWKNHLSLYPVPAGDAGFNQAIAKHQSGKGTVQFRYSDPLPLALIERLVTLLVERHLAASPGKHRQE